MLCVILIHFFSIKKHPGRKTQVLLSFLHIFYFDEADARSSRARQAPFIGLFAFFTEEAQAPR